MSARPRRSCLYMPGANAKALEKAKTLAADVLILDLEDSVAPEAKEAAREQVCAAVKAGGYGKREVIVRVNALATLWGRDDIVAAGRAGPNGVLAPKVESGEQVRALDIEMTKAGFTADAALWAMIETPRAILNLADIAAAARGSRLAVFVMGLNDLAKETRMRASSGRAAFFSAMSQTVTAARMEGLTAIDGVYNDIADTSGFETECRQGLEFGFDGKTLIHPGQIDACNNVFAPTTEEVARARAVIEAFALPENAGKGVIKVEGRMTELLHLEEAKRVVTVSEAIESLSA
jgi:citrate lyase subunit beta / citryl-CoA lyase